MITRNTSEISLLMRNAKIQETIIMTGARTAVRTIIM